MFTEADDNVYPFGDNFIPNDFKDVFEQAPPAPSEIAVAYSTQHDWRTMERRGSSSISVQFFADPPQLNVPFDSLSPLHKTLIKIIADGREQVIYLIGVTGSEKTEVILRICAEMAKCGKEVQIAASANKAATAFYEPTVHSMLGLSFQNSNKDVKASDSKCVSNAILYENTDLFIIDEISMVSVQLLGLIDDVMSKFFNPSGKNVAREKNHLLEVSECF